MKTVSASFMRHPSSHVQSDLWFEIFIGCSICDGSAWLTPLAFCCLQSSCWDERDECSVGWSSDNVLSACQRCLLRNRVLLRDRLRALPHWYRKIQGCSVLHELGLESKSSGEFDRHQSQSKSVSSGFLSNEFSEWNSGTTEGELQK